MSETFDSLCSSIQEQLHGKGRLTVALDGCCASGKTTLAGRIAKRLDADVIHMDDFFLPPSLRTPARTAEPGGNVHYERFSGEIADMLRTARADGSGKAWPALTYRRFDCRTGGFSPEPCRTKGRPLLIVEGAYCLRPEFVSLYDLRLFLQVSPEIQMQRLRTRNGENGCTAFRDKWIPLENRYFREFSVSSLCHMQLDGSLITS